MVKLPWRRRSGNDWDDWDDDWDDQSASHPSDDHTDHSGEHTDPSDDADAPLVSCQFQDGTLSVYEDILEITRPSRSKFDDKWIAMNQVRGITYKERFVIHYIQIEQVDFENDSESFLSTPVDENTLHFGGGMRPCAREARDAILERIETD